MGSFHSLLRFAIVSAFVLEAGPLLGQGITGSSHDFSGQAWSDGEICKICHTPHSSDITIDAPLWDHEVTAAAFTLYDSPTMDGAVGQPGAESKVCLSCHDGTVAIDSFGGATGSTAITGNALLGSDLSDDHPVGLTWSHQTTLTSNICANCHFTTNPIKFYSSKIECATCHEPHDNGAVGGGKMLRVTKAGSAICLHCHEK